MTEETAIATLKRHLTPEQLVLLACTLDNAIDESSGWCEVCVSFRAQKFDVVSKRVTLRPAREMYKAE
jgi:hypothetical protein